MVVRIDSKKVAVFKLLWLRDWASSLGRVIGGYNRGRAHETLTSFAERVDALAREAHLVDPSSLKLRVSRLRVECEQVVCPAMIPAGRSHFLEDAMTLLALARNVEQYCAGGEL